VLFNVKIICRYSRFRKKCLIWVALLVLVVEILLCGLEYINLNCFQPYQSVSKGRVSVVKSILTVLNRHNLCIQIFNSGLLIQEELQLS
jgi:hypothetical protein